ncbi:class 1 fructose-bisphosphatase [Nitrospirillum sp. BR 11828]|uniref:class 1 fructose-bisphosphatase n=1 Tax=Nitrospirillum sp. BR 11828 TaxID=3104325 RepID=UPI002ACA8BF0|nr:class 1 fructose-bisphosphatase [Nitrospirillum sp. BR 11828]MDZ5649306.1 class 1 fructose-bisphosphatase [Nitrospirillum sp. BR 11828]
MANTTTLARHLVAWSGATHNGEAQNGGTRLRADIVRTILALADAGLAIADLVAMGPLAGEMAAVRGESNGDTQKELDLRAHDIVVDRLAGAPVAVVGSEESDAPVLLDPAGTLVVAIDPLDGSSNIETNVSVGTIFSILGVEDATDPAASLLQPGHRQLAAGFLVYGPQTALVLTVGEGTEIFFLDKRPVEPLPAVHGGAGWASPAPRTPKAEFVRMTSPVTVMAETKEFAINASNQRHWAPSIRTYVDDCLAGSDGPRAKNYNMRWIASLVADAFRILRRGGVYLYPTDERPGYRSGRLRLVYEANPIALVIEQAGGAATDGQNRILDLTPRHLHERTALVFGSQTEVRRVAEHHTAPAIMADRAPLFGQRGLLRA